MKAHALAGADGLSGDEAWAAARRRIGSPLQLREQSREPWTRDGRNVRAGRASRPATDAARSGFTFTALANARARIGLNTAIFSVAYGVLWRPLPYPNPDRLVMISSAQQTETGVRTFGTWAPVSYEALRSSVTMLDPSPPTARSTCSSPERGEPLRLPALDVSPILRHAGRQSGARPCGSDRRRGAGRRSQRDRQRSALAHVAQGRSGDRRTVHQHRRPSRTVVGVLPPDFSSGQWWLGSARCGSGHLSAQSLPATPQERVSVPARPHESGVRQNARKRNDGAGERSVDRSRRRTSRQPAHSRRTPARSRARSACRSTARSRLRTLLLILLGACRSWLLIACVTSRTCRWRASPRAAANYRTHALGAGTPADRASSLLTEASVFIAAGRLLGVMLAQIAIHVTLPLVPPFVLPRLGGIRDRRARDGVLPRLVARLTLLVGLVPALRRRRAAFGEGLRAARRRRAHDGRPPGRAAADAAGRRADRDDARLLTARAC